MKKPALAIHLKSSIISRLLTAIMIVLILASIVGVYFNVIKGNDYVFGFVPKFDLKKENNFPTFFSSVILLISAALLGIIAVFKKRNRDLYFKHWLILAVIFLFLSLDETASLHEILIMPLRKAFHVSGIFYFAWVIPAIIFLLLFSISYIKFYLDLPRKTKFQFTVSALFYITGAVGMEMAGGFYASKYGIANLSYNAITTIEESFEMIGILIFINALLQYLKEHVSEVNITFE